MAGGLRAAKNLYLNVAVRLLANPDLPFFEIHFALLKEFLATDYTDFADFNPLNPFNPWLKSESHEFAQLLHNLEQAIDRLRT